MPISLRLNDREADLFRRYADMKGLTISEMIRQSVLSRIEDEFDLKAYDRAMAEFMADPTTYSIDDVERELGLT